MFFSNVWANHTDVVVHPSQLFTLSPQPMRLHSSDHLLRCFVHRTPASACAPASPSLPGAAGPASPRLGRLWRFRMYLGTDHRSLGRRGSGGGGGGGEGGGGGPQLLITAHQTRRRCYELHLGPGPATCPARGGGFGGLGGCLSPRSRAAGPHLHHQRVAQRDGFELGLEAIAGGSGCGSAASEGAGGCVAVLRSNLRCSHYELLPDTSSPWARRLVSLAGYQAPRGPAPPPLISLEYRLRVRGIMLPRRMKVQVPVPHHLQRVVHNPLYDMHGPLTGGGGGGSAAPVGLEAGVGGGGGGWQPAFVGAGGGAVMAPPMLAAAAAAGPLAGPGGAEGLGVAGNAAGPGGDGAEGLMDNLEEILEAIRTEPLLFANLVDTAAAVRPDDEQGLYGGGAAAAAAVAAPVAAGEPGGAAAAAGGASLRRHRAGSGGGGGGGCAGWGLGTSLLRGFLSGHRHALSTGGAEGAGGGSHGSVQWWGPQGSPPGAGGDGSAAAAAAAGGGWACSAPAPAAPCVRLQNKAPHWNDALMCWCLNFRGRVKMASVKNFQLMANGDGAGRCVMQFGKVEEGMYILDFNPCVLTAAQAFAAALSTFETKYLL